MQQYPRAHALSWLAVVLDVTAPGVTAERHGDLLRPRSISGPSRPARPAHSAATPSRPEVP